MVTRAALVLFGALLALGCGDNTLGGKQVDLPSDMSVHPSFGAQAEIVVAAADEWERATGGVAKMNPHIGNDGTVRVRVGTLAQDTQGQADTTLWESGVVIDLATIATEASSDGLSQDEVLRDTVLHELGHVFGIGHLESGLMTDSGYGGGCIDQLALDAFCENYGCPASATRPTCDLE